MQKTKKRHKETILNKNIATTFVEFKKKKRVIFIPLSSYTKKGAQQFGVGVSPLKSTC